MTGWKRLISVVDAPRFISALGGLYLALAVGRAMYVTAGGGQLAEVVSGLVLVGIPGLLILYGGYRLPDSDLHPDVYGRIVAWCLGGFGALLGVVGLRVVSPGVAIDDPVWSAVLATAFGSAAGLAVGGYEARAFSRAREAEERNRELRRYETLFEGATDVNAVLDPDGSFRYLTPSVERVLGYGPEELVGEVAFEYMHPTDRQEAMEAFAETVESGGTSRTVVFRFEHADGGWVYLEGRGRNMLDDPVVEGIVAYTHDVSERIERERDLEQYETVAQTASDVIVTIDARSRIQSVNPAVEDVFGYEYDELVGEPLTKLMPESLREQHRDSLQRYLRTDERSLDWNYLELPGLHDEGYEVPLAVSFSEYEHEDERFFTGIIRDNTERKRLEADLRRARDLRERIVETSPIGIATLAADGEVTFLNDRGEQLLGRTSEELDEPPGIASILELTGPDAESLSEADRPSRRIIETGESVYDLECSLTHPDGERRWLSVNGAPLFDETGEIERVVMTFEDVTERRRYRDRLVALNELSQELETAETEDEVADLVAAVASDALELSCVAIGLYDDDAGRLRTAARTDAVADIVGDDSLFGSDRGLPWQVYVDQTPAVYDDLQAEAELPDAGTPLRSAIVLPLDEHGVFVAGATTPGEFSETTVSLAKILVGNAVSALDRVARERTLRERRDALVERTTALERVRRLNEIIRGITQELIQASTREEVVQAVCDRLVTTEGYRLAWIGARDTVTQAVTPDALAGAEDGYLDTITVTADAEGGDGAGDGGREPAGAAIRTRKPQVRNALSADPPFEPWRQAAIERGYQACIAVPLTYQDSLYGVLALYADEPGVFDEMERAVLGELGGTIGYTLNALERRQALVSDESVELEFELRSANVPLVAFAAEHDCEFAFETIVQRTGESPRVFFTIRGVAPDVVLEFGAESPEIESIALISEREGEALFECQPRGSAFFSALVDRGGMPRTLEMTGEVGHAVVRVPRSGSVRTYVELFEARFDDVDLVARREVEESIKTQHEYEAELVDRLTERQQEILKTAYATGFFDWPRGASAQDLAELLDVSQPTVSRHIRAGERTLFGLVFDEE